MTIPIDMSSGNGVFDWLFHSADVYLFGSVGLMVFAILAGIMLLLMFFNANRFTVIGFMGSVMLALGIYGYTIVGWIAPVGAMIAGLLFAVAFIKVIGI